MNTNINLREFRDISQEKKTIFIFAETRKPVKEARVQNTPADDNVNNFPQVVPGRFQGGSRGEGIYLMYFPRV